MLLINIIGFALIGLIVWWFWLYKPQTQATKSVNNEQGTMIITVADGVYQPARIILAANKSTRVKFLRKDASPCAGTVLFPDFEISADLALNKEVEITLPAMSQGEYAFHCQMQMYKGSVLVQ